jgi:formate hydrogenlyase subunit 3/multisubunit Na+/H+ antiporter MnhD subunit
MTALLVRSGLLVALAAALASAVVGLVARSRKERQWSHLLLGTGSGIGALAAAVFLLLDSPTVPVAGTMLAVDRLSAFFLLLVHLVTVMTSWFGARYTEEERIVYPLRVVLPLTAVFVASMQGVLLSTGVAGFVLCWEGMSIASFFLVMADGKEASRRAALLYLAVAQFGAGALIVGFGLMTGGQLFAALADLPRLSLDLSPSAASLATFLLLFAFGSKAGVAPLHAWLPEAHPRAPSHVSALMSGVMLKVALYGLIRVASICWPTLGAGWGLGLLVLGLGGATVAAISANLNREVKRVLAWSSVENIGLIVTMFGFSVLLRSRGLPGLGEAVRAAMYVHIFAHALFKAGLFLGAGAIAHETHTGQIESLGGLAARMPRLSAAMLVLALSAAALPPSGTFVAEWQWLQAAVVSMWTRQPQVMAAGVVVLVGTGFVAGLAAFAMVRLFAFVFLAEPRSAEAHHAQEPSRGFWAPVASLAGGVLALGFLSPWLSWLLPTGPGHAEVVTMPLVTGVPGASTPAALGLVIVAAGACGLVLARRLSGPGRIRQYHTWDCGQPIDHTMEYTATAFSAPVRFFLRDLVRAEKHVTFAPVVPTNRWIRSGKMEFRSSEGILERIYFPIAALVEGVGQRLRRLQNGVIQFYIALVLATLLITLWVAL